MLSLQKLLSIKQSLPRTNTGLYAPLILVGSIGSGRLTLAKTVFPDNGLILDMSLLDGDDIMAASPLMSDQINISSLQAKNIGENEGSIFFCEPQFASVEAKALYTDIILSGKVYGEPLGKNVQIIILALPDEDNGIEHSIHPAIFNRSFVVNMED